jgi:signal transduction histidine kinase
LKLVAKFLAALLLVSGLCLGIYAYLAARQEVQALESSVGSDMAALGDGLREGMIAAHALGGGPAVDAFVHSVSVRRSDVSIVGRVGESIPLGTRSMNTSTGERRVSAFSPVELPAGPAGVLEVSRTVPGESQVLRDQLVEQLAVGGALVLGVGLIAVVLGATLIARPLTRVVEQARRIGEGDLSQRLHSGRSDELGILKRELNAMCDRLVDAQKRVEDESTARVETLEQLRHLDRLRTVGTLASGIAHELGTPLNVILIRAQSLTSAAVPVEDVADAVRVIVSQVEKMSRIVRQLLDFARREVAAPTLTRLSEVAIRTERLLVSMAKKHDVRIRVNIEEDSDVMANGEHLEQAVTNLVINGIQAMPRGGDLAIEVCRQERRRPNSDRVAQVGVIAVKDTGVGIDAEQLGKIFEPFFTTKPSGVGTGLGLCVASGIATEYEGWIDATSKLGEGSTFAICIPRDR